MGTDKVKSIVVILLVFFISGCVSSSKKEKSYPMHAATGIDQQGDVEPSAASSAAARLTGTIVDAKLRLAKYFQRIDKHRIAVEVLRELIEIDPGNAEAHNAMGISYDYLGNYAEAQLSYHTALLLAPDADDIYNNLGYSYIMAEDYGAAVNALSQAIHLNPEIPRYRKNLGLAYFMAGDYEQAKAAFRTAEGKAHADRTMARLSAVYGVDTTPVTEQEIVSPAEEKGALPAVAEEAVLKGSPADDGLVIVPADEASPFVAEAVNAGDQETAVQETASSAVDVADSGNTADAPADDVQGEMLAAVAPMAPSNDALSTARAEPANATLQETTGAGDQPPAAMPVEIVNGNGVPHMARNVAKYLEERGMIVAGLANSDHFGHATTIVYFQKGYELQANNLVARLPEMSAPVQLTEDAEIKNPLRLLLGHDMASLNPLFSNQMQLEVSNGNGVNGMARRVGDYLQGRNLNVVRLTNADKFDYDQTTLYYGEGQKLIAQFIARELPGKAEKQLQAENHDGKQIRILLGSDMVF